MAEVTAAAPFVMHGAREVLEAGAVHIEQQIVAIEQAVDANPGLAFDLAKSLVESTCKIVLADRGCACDEGWDLPKLLKETLGRLRLIPECVDGDQAVSVSLRKTVGGLQTVIQGICELRNTHGFASHGRDASFQQLESVQALLVARSADTVVSFLFRVHRGYAASASPRLLAYGDNPAFNDHVDEANEPVRIFSLSYKPSEVLFQVDPQAYQDYLAGYGGEVPSGAEEASVEGEAEVPA